MKEKYKYLIFRKLYQQLSLNKIEQKLVNNGVAGINNDGFSKYFCLLNEIYEEQLPANYIEQYKKYFSLPMEQLLSKELENVLDNFLEQTYRYLLFKKIDEDYLYYGPVNDNYVAPTDAIVLGLCYEEFNINDDESFDQKHKIQEDLICDICNNIQFDLANRVNKKIAVITYNEYSLKYIK